ncbi:hypothetical protein BP00DRAFT_126493 [Aspergillus indologenus CBS 114.80]|uniref:Amino acid transporter transmembrane domain-containing protein n=1 Tax=Aspergillus indologenus CBS 114.80 TaxID=1450541 RepID=A0A2V5IDP9_9EURO|nr:hypothetical protein BP00DRAFT_126493 [Aspergillus indologenus CBS 114.80]
MEDPKRVQHGFDPPEDIPEHTEDKAWDEDKISKVASSDQTPHNSIGEGNVDTATDSEKQKIAEGAAHFRRLGWKRLTVVLVVEAIALGVLTLPTSFAILGMVAGTICCVGVGVVAIYASYLVGETKIALPNIHHYGDVGTLMLGKFGRELFGIMFVLQLILVTASYCLTGTIAFDVLTNNATCSMVFGIVSAVLLMLLAIMPSFTDAAILGYIDFVSIMAAIIIAIIATGVEAANSPGGLAGVNWSAWPRPGTTVADGFIAVSNIVFAYSFSMYQFSFMDEMHTPQDYMKAIWTLGGMEIVIYTLVGALIYAFVGVDVQSPALLSMSSLMAKIAFGVALPVIYISGALNNTVTARYVHLRMYENSVVRFINTPKGWITWLLVLLAITVAAWIISEVIPFFNDLLALSSALFVSGFVLYIPAVMWFMFLRKREGNDRKRLLHDLSAAFLFCVGVIVLGGGTYASIVDIKRQFDIGAVRGVFTCAPMA